MEGDLHVCIAPNIRGDGIGAGRDGIIRQAAPRHLTTIVAEQRVGAQFRARVGCLKSEDLRKDYFGHRSQRAPHR
jgi:hypothetical protein